MNNKIDALTLLHDDVGLSQRGALLDQALSDPEAVRRLKLALQFEAASTQLARAATRIAPSFWQKFSARFAPIALGGAAAIAYLIVVHQPFPADTGTAADAQMAQAASFSAQSMAQVSDVIRAGSFEAPADSTSLFDGSFE